MSKRDLFAYILFILVSTGSLYSQSQTCVWINGGPDVNLCLSKCTTLKATYINTYQTSAYTISTPTYSPDPFNVGTPISLGNDAQSATISLPFSFCYFGTVYNSFIIGSNGWVGFSITTSSGTINNPVPDNSGQTPLNCIMGPWQDLNPGAGGTIRYQVYGSTPCRRLTVSWDQVPMNGCGTPVSQQIIIYETTNIIDNYIQNKVVCAGTNNGRAIQALHNSTGNGAYLVPGRNSPTQWTANNDAVRYTPSGNIASTVVWLDNNNNIISNADTVRVCPTATTNYTAQITHTGCGGQNAVVQDPVTVNVTSLPVTITPNSSICSGNNLQLNATSPTGVAWSWVPVTGLSNPNVSNPVASPTTTTTYTCYISDAGGCQGAGTVTVTVNSNTGTNAGPDDTICYNASAQLNGSGGITYSWMPSSSLSNNLIANPVATPAVTTNYTLYTTDANGCTGSDIIIILVNPQITLSTAGFPTSCSGSCNGQAIVIPSGGTQPYNYSWSPGNATTAAINNLCPAIYTITVTDKNGCTESDTAHVNQPGGMILSTSTSIANCGQSNGQACVTANGGTPPYSYLWNPSLQAASCAINIPSGIYTVTVTDFNGCTKQKTDTVKNPPGVNASLVNQFNASCYGACDGSATITASGGPTPYTYLWYPTGGTLPAASGLCAGIYTCYVTDANSCKDSVVVTITHPSNIKVNTTIASDTICIGQCTNITASASGGSGSGYTYTWMPGNMTGSQINVCPTTTTGYTVISIDGTSCGSSPDSFLITVRPPLNVIINGATNVCPGACTVLSAQVTGGDPSGYTYVWTPNVGSTAAVQVCPTSPTIYSVSVNDGCTTLGASDTTLVGIFTPPVVTIYADTLSGCKPLCVDFFNTTTNATTFTWSFNGADSATSNIQNPTSICYSNSGTFDVSLTVTDINGCSNSATNTGFITVHPDPTASFVYTPNPININNSDVLFSDMSINANSWSWIFDLLNDPSVGSVNQNPTYTYTDSGDFSVMLIVASADGCTDTITQTLHVDPVYSFHIPNSFTPNGDGLNDEFMPYILFPLPKSYTFTIYDRWGMRIFETNDVEKGWDGKVRDKSKDAMQDVYVWRIIVKDFKGAEYEYIGHVTLIRGEDD